MNEQIQRVVITDLRIPFLRLVMFFVKATLAAIPAAIIVTLVIMLIAAVLALAFGGNASFITRRWTL